MIREFEVTDDLLASGGQRFVNYIVDVIVLYILIIIISFIVTIVAFLFGSSAVIEKLQNISTLESYLIFFSIMIPYYSVLEHKTSRTVGKFITKIMVVMEDGSRPDSGTTLRRTLCRIIPFEAFSFLGSYSRGWHDSIPDTYVVRKEAFEKAFEMHNSFDEIGKPQEEI